jgi:hypothetical protein
LPKELRVPDEPDDLNLPTPLTSHARRELDRFMRQYQRSLKRSRRVSLTVLVWGPAPAAGGAVAGKRRDIRDRLREAGHNAQFSEDIPDVPLASGLSEKSKEYAQACEAHLVVMLLEDSPGALAEAHDFANDPEIAPNVLAIVPKQYEEGYSARGALADLANAYNGVFWYSAEDLAACNVLARAMRAAESRRQILYRARGRSS